ncbi:MAG: sugar phosphate isomerase/epimerase [Sedimentisphaerales bacterium]|nr:sugar phosphate isomerase/epimerase [Sedimentisphaerales bacterium]
MAESLNRRKFLCAAGLAAAAGLTRGHSSKALAISKGIKPETKLKLGLASYTLRKFDLDKTIETTKKLDLKYIKLKSMHLPLDSSPEQIKAAAAKIEAAGIKLYGCGVVYMSKEEQVHQAFDYAKAAGMELIVGVPSYKLLGLVNDKVQQYDIKMAIHNHGPGDKRYPTPESVYERVKNLDRRVGLCLDIGHTERSGIDPAEAIERYIDRIYDFDIKDVSESTAKGGGVEFGRGVVDLPKVIRTLKKVSYSGVVAIEYEKDGDDPLAGLAESTGYVRALIDTV